MREFKFRAWDKEHEEMHSWETVKSEFIMSDFEDEDLAMLQYTGLTDKNGREIYEGDVIKLSYPTTDGKYVITKLYTVSYDHGVYLAKKVKSHPYGTTSLSIVNGESEIIGNIYENTELVEGEE